MVNSYLFNLGFLPTYRKFEKSNSGGSFNTSFRLELCFGPVSSESPVSDFYMFLNDVTFF